MIDSRYAVTALLAMAVVTIALRAVPFVAARWLKRWPIIEELGRFLPPVIMTLLLLQTVKGYAAGHADGVWMEVAAVALTVVLQLVWRHALLSILLGTGLYVVLRMGLPVG